MVLDEPHVGQIAPLPADLASFGDDVERCLIVEAQAWVTPQVLNARLQSDGFRSESALRNATMPLLL